MIVGVLLAVLILAPAGLYLWASTRDLSRYQNQIAEQVRKATGRELTMRGALRVNFTLSPSAVVENVVLANAAGGSRPDMARIKRLVLHLDPYALLLGEVRIGRIQLFGADILIERDDEGRSNLAMEPPVEGSGPHPSEHQSLRIKTTPSLPWIGRIEVEGSTLTLRETAERSSVVLVIDRFVGTAPQPNAPLSGEFLGRINGSEALTLTLKKAGTFEGWLKGVPGDLDMQGTLGGAPVSITGQITPRRMEMAADVEGRSLAGLGHLLNLPLPDSAPYSMKVKLTNPRSGAKLEVTELKVGDSVFRGDLVFRTNKAGKPVVVANFASDRLDLNDLKPRPQPTPVPTTNGGMAPPPAGTPGTAQAAVPPTPPQPPPAAPTPVRSAAGDGRVIPSEPYPVEAIRRWNGSLSLRVGEVVGAVVKMQGVSLSIALNDGKLTFRPAATIGSGQIGIDAQIDASGPGPVLIVSATTAKVPLDDLMALLGINAGVKGGLVDLELKLRGSGRTLRESMGLAVGNLDFVLGQAQITRDAAHLLTPEWTRMLGGLGDRPATLNCAAGKVEFGGRPEGERGSANVRKLVLDAQRFTAIGGGYIHLRNEQLHLLMWPEPRELPLLSVALPLRWKGTLAQASAETDVGALKAAAGSVPGTRFASMTAAITTAARNTNPGALNPCASLLARLDTLRPYLRTLLPQPSAVAPEYRPPRAPRRAK